MSLYEKQARYRRLHSEQSAWRLLRADSAPIILAFIDSLFVDEQEVLFARARAALEAELPTWQEAYGMQDNANSHLRNWIHAGWIREHDDQLTRTDAFHQALRFAEGLESRDTTTSATHLRRVQDAVRDLAVALNPSAEERLLVLREQLAEMNEEVLRLEAGIVPELSSAEQRERVRGVYQMASGLTGDFRRVEDDIRLLDQSIRVQMIESEGGRGLVIQNLLDNEDALLQTDAGQAFDGFFRLLCDENRSVEFREQIRSILERPTARSHLNAQEIRFLIHLVRELSRESQRVISVRRRTQESLRAFVEAGAQTERRAVERVLRQLEKLAVTFKDQDIGLRTSLNVHVGSGTFSVSSPSSIRLMHPQASLDTSKVVSQSNQTSVSDIILECLEAVKIQEVAEDIRDLLESHGPMSLAQIAELRPIQGGLEELVAFVRIAKAIEAVSLEGVEHLVVADRQGQTIRAKIPVLLLSANLFPENLESLPL